MRREQRRYVRLGEQRVDRGEPAAGIGHGDLAGALVVSRPAGLGTGATSTPWASAAAPLRFVAPRTRTRYLPPGASGRAVCTTSRSDGTERCCSSLRTRAVSRRKANVSRGDGAAGARWTAGGAAGAGGAGGAACAVVSLARRSESAIARARACIESYWAAPYSARTGNGVVSGSVNTRTRAVSSGCRGSSGSENTRRNAAESTGSTLFTRGPTLSCTNSHSTALAVESTLTVTVSNASRRSSRRLLF